METRFFDIYAEDLPPKGIPAEVGDKTQEGVDYSCNFIAGNVAGGDGWRHRELKWLGPFFCKWVACLVNMSEEGQESHKTSDGEGARTDPRRTSPT